MGDLDATAIEIFRDRWIRKSGRAALRNLSQEQLLADAELMIDGQVTYAALILLGASRTLGRYLSQSEVIFEYRSDETSGPARQRISYRSGYLLYEQDLWNAVNLRNDTQLFQSGLFV